MDKRRLETSFFIALLLVVIFFSWLVLKPYVSVIILAGTLALVFEPIYRNFLRFFRYESVAALAVVLLVVLIVFLPLGFFAVRIISEVTTLYASLASNGGFDFGTAINNFLRSYFPSFPIPVIAFNFNESIRQGLTWFIQNFGSLFSGVVQVLFIGFLSLLGLFFFLRDGKKLKRWTVNLLPLSPKYTEEIIQETSMVIHSVTSGTLIVAIIQGLVAGFGFFLFNIPNAAFWGSVVVVSSLIPIVGTWLVVVPAIAYLFFTGQTALSISLAIWGIILVNLIYNVLSPQLMGRGNNIHPLVILLSVLGGIVLFGPIGFLMGPFVIALLFSLLNIYPKLVLKGGSSLKKR